MSKHCILLLLVCLVAFGAWADQTESEVNDSRFSADGPINFNERLTGGLPGSYGGDSGYPMDYWEFSADGGTLYTFTATPQNSSFVAPLDVALDIENSSGTVLATEDTYGDHQAETLNWTASSTGTYYLVIYEPTGISNSVAWYTCDCEESSGVDDWCLY